MQSILSNKAANLISAFAEWNEIRAGELAVRIAETSREIEAAQSLRYRVFYEEMSGTPPTNVRALRRDFDMFDAVCDHLLVFDCALPRGEKQIIGTYRLLRQGALGRLGKFYSENEFDITALRREKGEILELGRSCVDSNYRNRGVINLLWRGIAAYVSQHNVKLMFGCASLSGADVKAHGLALSYLHHYRMGPPDLHAEALPERYVEMNLMPKEAVDTKIAFTSLPPLIKGYLRAGGYVGHGAVIDTHCDTIDVGMSVKTHRITEKYAQHYALSFRQNHE